mgnify:CR=1 FL=1
MNTTVAIVARTTKPVKTPYAVFAIGLDRLYSMELALDEIMHSRCMAIDRYIDSNGWTWDALIEESEKPEVSLN